jgi:predicted ester cyclase
MGLEENKAVVHRLFDTINNGRLDELPEVVAPDVIDHNAVIFMQPEGPGGVQEGVRMLLQGFPDLHLAVKELIAEGDQVVARFTTSGTNTGDYRGLPAPTGAALRERSNRHPTDRRRAGDGDPRHGRPSGDAHAARHPA